MGWNPIKSITKELGRGLRRLDDLGINQIFTGDDGGGFGDFARHAQEEMRRRDTLEQARNNTMPGPAGGNPSQMTALNIQRGVNPFADAANRAGFADFPTNPNPTPQPPAGTLGGAANSGLNTLFGNINDRGGLSSLIGLGREPGKMINRGTLGNQAAQAAALRGGSTNGG